MSRSPGSKASRRIRAEDVELLDLGRHGTGFNGLDDSHELLGELFSLHVVATDGLANSFSGSFMQGGLNSRPTCYHSRHQIANSWPELRSSWGTDAVPIPSDRLTKFGDLQHSCDLIA